MPLLKRGLVEVPNDPLEKEVGAHKTGFGDMAKAGIELARSPISTVVTPVRISRGYSTTDRLIDGEEDFPAGRAMVHSWLDTFGFAELADMDRAAMSGVTTVMQLGSYHNSMLFAPNEMLDNLTPVIFPAAS